jgi:hypothetical protein
VLMAAVTLDPHLSNFHKILMPDRLCRAP